MAEKLPQQDRPELPLYFWERKIFELQHAHPRIVEEALLTMGRIADEHRIGGIKREVDVKAIVRVQHLLDVVNTIFNRHPVLNFVVMEVLNKYLHIYDEDFVDCELTLSCLAAGIYVSIRSLPRNQSINFITRRMAVQTLYKYFPSIERFPVLPEGRDFDVEDGTVADSLYGWKLPNAFWLQKAIDFRDNNETIVHEALRTMRALADDHDSGVFKRHEDVAAFVRDPNLLDAFGSIFDRQSPQLDDALEVLEKYLDIHTRHYIPGLPDMLFYLGIYRTIRSLVTNAPFENIRLRAAKICREHFAQYEPKRQERPVDDDSDDSN